MSKTKRSKPEAKGEDGSAPEQAPRDGDARTVSKTSIEAESERKSKKRKRRAVDGQDGAAAEPGDTTERPSKRERKSKAKQADNRPAAEESSPPPPLENVGDKPTPVVSATSDKDERTKSKKDKKNKKSQKEKKSKDKPIKDNHESEVQPAAESSGQHSTESHKLGGEDPVSEAAKQVEEAADAPADGRKDRFIVFVGNLPYSATKEQMEAHFAKAKPTAIRLMTDKVTQKPRGFGFLEFEHFDRMETCLKKYQHSQFPDPTNKKLGYRKINIELTSGGGGNTEHRKEKIRAKNEKLAEERDRDRVKREEVEQKQKERKEKKEKMGKGKGGKKDELISDADGQKTADESGIHPSRLAQMRQGPAPAQPTRKRFGQYN